MSQPQSQSLGRPIFGAPPGPPPRSAVQGIFPVLLLVATLLGCVAAYRTRQPLAAVAPPGLALVGYLCSVRPTYAFFGLFALTGFVGSISAFTPLSSPHLVDVLLVGLWLAAGWFYLSDRPDRTPKLWLPLVPILIYLAVTLFEVPLAATMKLGIDSFKASAWFMAAALLVAFSPWQPRTHLRMARLAVAAGLVVGTYCAYRKFVGSSPKELAVAFAAQPGIPRNVAPRFFGSFESANELAAWGAMLIPFALSMAMLWRGRWRLAAIGAVGMLTIATFASDIRTGIVAAALGVMLVLLLYYAASAFRSRRLTVLGTVLIVGFIGFGAYGVAVQGGEHARFAAIFSPGNDKGYTDRVQRWNAALNDMSHHPFGRGLGTAGGVAARENEFGPAVTPYLDSSYLKVGLEQGMAVMILYAGALLVLLVAMCRRAIRFRSGAQAALTIGAAGTLISMLFLFYAGLYSEGPGVLVGWLIVGLGIAQTTITAPAPPAGGAQYDE